MIKIIKIEKKKTFYSITILNEIEVLNFKITEDLLIESKFLSLKEISQAEYKDFLTKIPKDTLILESLSFLDKKYRSLKEVKEFLLTKTTSLKLVNEVINTLKEKALIDDDLYYKVLLDYLINVKKMGRVIIYNKLDELGLNTSFIYDTETLKNNIEDLIVKYDYKNKDLPRTKRLEKCRFYLINKGYTENDLSLYFNESLFKKYEIENKTLDKDYQKLKEKYADDIYKIKMNLLKKGYSKEKIEEYLYEQL